MHRLREHHLHLPHFSVDMNHNMRVLYGVRFLRDAINKLTMFFVPIYVYQQATSGAFDTFLSGDPFRKGITAIALFYLLCSLTTVAMQVPIAQFAKRFGHATLIAGAHLFVAIALGLLFFSEATPPLIFGAAVAEGLQICFFWPSYYTLISKYATKNHMGHNLGAIQFLIQLSSLISPAIGGSIAALFGFHTLFLVGMVVVFITLIVATFMKVEKEVDLVSVAEFRSWMRESSFGVLALSYSGRYIHDAVYLLWPVYVFLVLGAVESVGYLYTLSLFLAMMMTFVGGVYVDSKRSKKPFLFTGLLISGLWILRAQVINFWHIAIIDTVDKLSSNFHWLAYDATYMKRGKGSQAYSFFVYRELIIHSTAICFWFIIAALFSTIQIGWAGLFGAAAVGVLVSLLIKETYIKKI